MQVKLKLFGVYFRYTMTKSSAVLFILFFSLVFKLEEPVSVKNTQFLNKGLKESYCSKEAIFSSD